MSTVLEGRHLLMELRLLELVLGDLLPVYLLDRGVVSVEPLLAGFLLDCCPSVIPQVFAIR